ncbi:uncharacterized protein N7473_010361 [Penicillium subrubescens]|uniref:uncharacterized protein n=1 Tax=Penicillium subrubescens TaxID=1316194 RepID=UPI002545674D|nr:uncharacterized protein N7473_010361 [Penicillium subrubescens]KAJ5883475.1 hypothetical protein N7473_010361 [Penicillium subrubescens]
MREETNKWREIEEASDDPEKSLAWDAPQNTLMMQGFEWHVPADQKHWQRLRIALPSLRDAGVDNIWIPPGCKGMVPSVTARGVGIGIYWDAVLNHKAGADSTERFSTVKVDPKDRTIVTSKPQKISGWVGFDFPGRKGKYSTMKYHHRHFNGVDWDESRKQQAIYKTAKPRKYWAKDVIRADIFKWAEWIGTELPISGMRINAAKHFSAAFQKQFVDHLRNTVGADYFIVGEYWRGHVRHLLNYLKVMEYGVSLFDVPLLGRFAVTSKTEGSDLREIFRGTLVEQNPAHAVTFVGNHDTQLGQSLETVIAPFFKPIAYALILLRAQGQPCVFYGDLYGTKEGAGAASMPSCMGKLPVLMRARKLYAYGDQRDYFEKKNCIGFVRYGNEYFTDGLACVISNMGATYKRMYVGVRHEGEEWTDVLEWCIGTVFINTRGYGMFPVSTKSVSVWVNNKANGRRKLSRPL